MLPPFRRIIFEVVGFRNCNVSHRKFSDHILADVDSSTGVPTPTQSPAIRIVPNDPNTPRLAHWENYLPSDNKTVAPGNTNGNPTIFMRLGSDKRHVGHLKGQEMYDKIYACLEQLCGPTYIACDVNAHCEIPNIVYRWGAITKNNGVLVIQVLKWEFTPASFEKTVEIVHALMHQVAGIFKAESDRNCYLTPVDFLEKLENFCNTGNWAGVHEDKYGSTLDVGLYFENIAQYHFDCEDAKGAATNFLDTEVANDIKQSLEVGGYGSYVDCV